MQGHEPLSTHLSWDSHSREFLYDDRLDEVIYCGRTRIGALCRLFKAVGEAAVLDCSDPSDPARSGLA